MSAILLVLVALGFLSIVIEDIVHIDKAKTTLFFGSLVWVLFFISPPGQLNSAELMHALNENLLDIATLWLFLMAAMTFVAYLSSKGLIDGLVNQLLPAKMSERSLMMITGLFAFVFSSMADIGVSGHLYPGQPAEAGSGNTIHLAVDGSLDDAMSRVKAAGGQVMSPTIDIPAGSFFYATDPDGNSIGLFTYN